ncbi:hypothetical protein M2139_000306 [Enterococcus sp. PF1-24]|uniref:primase alpha helix C-terminal domain-containing protein n=1 Tax=unclassified Enterococcus TaxID=2608891 RepID=UPI0024735025|nr:MULTISPECIES: primase alpha helix C-terminal domain-containing protein [unclassified Enterococcus]MDH6363274.1 hypothetical protein [Enterococcus sp. PFB1-1]MDH6400425.1 hypothetical protein [Enterococcus sp. PF1-24]
MIYIGTVRPSLMNEPVDVPLLDFFGSYNPQKILDEEVLTNTKKMDVLKTKKLKGFISGNMKELTRKNENLLSRDCLVLDLDDVIVTEGELVKWFKRALSDVSYIAYPSVSNGVKGVRYRLIVPFKGSIEKEADYKLLVDFFTKHICKEINGVPDSSNRTWSQIMLLPVITPYNPAETILIHKGEKVLKLVELLEGAKKWKENQKNVVRKPVNGNVTRYRNTTTELLESLVLGCDEGGRNNHIAKITGQLLSRAVDVGAVFELVEFANSHFNPPLEQKELEATFYSIAKRELSQ